MKILNSSIFTTVIFFTSLFLSSCSGDNPCELSANCPSVDPLKVTERIDVKINGVETEYYTEISLEEDVNHDLVKYNYSSNNTNKIDFIIQLDNNRNLTIKLYNQLVENPWEFSDIYYGIFPTKTLDDKYKYITVELKGNASSEAFTYSSILNTGSALYSSYVDVFRVEEFNIQTNELLGRLNDMVLHQVENPENTITLNGTFRGAITF